MLAILATDLKWGLANTNHLPTGIPWNSSIDRRIFKFMSMPRYNVCSKSTYNTLPSVVQKNRSFKLLTSNPQAPNEYTFEQLLNQPLSPKHLLIGGLKAYTQLLPKCSAVVHTTIQDVYNCNLKLPFYTLSGFNSSMRIFDYPAHLQQPGLSVDIYFNNGLDIPIELIQFLRELSYDLPSAQLVRKTPSLQ